MKTKISKTTWLVLGIGIFVILMAMLIMNYRNQTAEQAGLNRQITSIKQQITKIPVAELTAKQTLLNKQLAENNTGIQAIKTSLTQPPHAGNVVSTLYSLAKVCNIEIEDIKSAGISSQKLEKISFSSLPLTVAVKGSVSDILAFTEKITSEYSTCIVNPVGIDIPVPPPVPPPSTSWPYTWKVDSGEFPPWATLDPSTGAIIGVPDTIGTWEFTLKATDKVGNSATRPFSLSVYDPLLEIKGEIEYGSVSIPYNRNSLSVTCDPPPNELPPPAPDLTPGATITFNILSYEGN